MANSNGNTTDGNRDLGAMVDRARGEIEEVADRAKDVADRAKNALDTADRRLTDTMRENPMLVLGVAVGVGYVIGRVFSRIR